MDLSSVNTARNQAQQAATSANAFSAKGNVLADELRKAIGERFKQSGIAQDTAKARTDFMAAAPQARAEIVGLLNKGSTLSPTQQNAIMAASRGAALTPLMGANLVQDAAFGTMEDLINAGTNAFKAKTQEQQGLASIAQGNYSSILNELIKRAEEERAAQTMAWNAEQQDWKRQMQPIEMQTALAKLADIGKGTGSTATERMAAEKQELIKLAMKEKSYDDIRELILGNGYNPDDPDFSGLFGGDVLNIKNAGNLKALGVEGDYQLNPDGGTTLVPKKKNALERWWESIWQ